MNKFKKKHSNNMCNKSYFKSEKETKLEMKNLKKLKINSIKSQLMKDLKNNLKILKTIYFNKQDVENVHLIEKWLKKHQPDHFLKLKLNLMVINK